MRKYKVFLSAGEPSGDFLGSHLMNSLKCRFNNNIEFAGLGGSLMEGEGMSSLFPIEELSIMGLAEIIPHIWRIRKRISETVDTIEKINPDIVVTIDSPGFNFRVGKMLKKRGKIIPLVHYVAPSVWAWRPGRAKSIAQFLNHLLVLFPFEPRYFLKEGLPTQFVGHPVVELGLENTTDFSFRQRHNIPLTATILTVLPGSRRGEISRLLPVFQKTILKLQQNDPNLHVVIPTLPHLVNQIHQRLTVPATIVTTQLEKIAALQESRAALAASGTVSLELGAARLPSVIAYKMNPITHFVINFMVKVKYACLLNILMNKEIVPERLQQKCTPENLALALGEVLYNDKMRESMKTEMKRALSMLNAPSKDLSPSQCAAQYISQVLGIDDTI